MESGRRNFWALEPSGRCRVARGEWGGVRIFGVWGPGGGGGLRGGRGGFWGGWGGGGGLGAGFLGGGGGEAGRLTSSYGWRILSASACQVTLASSIFCMPRM